MCQYCERRQDIKFGWEQPKLPYHDLHEPSQNLNGNIANFDLFEGHIYDYQTSTKIGEKKMTKTERNNLIKEIYDKGLLEQLYKEVMDDEKQKLVAVGDVKLKQKIVVEDENGKETWSAIVRPYGGTVFLLDKEYAIDSEFGEDNNYSTSVARDIATTCAPVARILKKYGVDAFIPTGIDLLSLDGLKDYGVHKGDLTAIMTLHMYRNNRENIDTSCMWLSTPNSTPSGAGSSCVQYVDSFGSVDCDDCCWNDGGVRPFCILKSSVLVSLE